MRKYVKYIALLLLLALAFSMLGCGGNTTGSTPGNMDPVEVLPGYDYSSVDLTQYVSFADWDRRDMTIEISAPADVTDEAVKKEFNSYFNQKDNVYYQAIADKTKAVADGDTVYMYYTGVLTEVLEKAVRDGKIADVLCTGKSYSDILALGLGVQGGTTSNVTSLKIGSNSYIAGFESGLVGYVPATSGEENPVRLQLSFPTNYGNAELAGKGVIFFCKLIYIGDVAAGAYTADNISVEMVNTLLNISGENAYASLEDCFTRIREGLEKTQKTELRNAKASAIFSELLKKAQIPTVPDEMLTTYVDSVISTYLRDFVEMYNNKYDMYSYYFGTTPPSERLVAVYFGYQTEDYRDKMKADSVNTVKQEMIFWYFVQTEEITLSESEIAARRADYVEQYGEAIFEGVTDEVIYEQFLRDKFVEDQIAVMEEKGNITYKPAEENAQ